MHAAWYEGGFAGKWIFYTAEGRPRPHGGPRCTARASTDAPAGRHGSPRAGTRIVTRSPADCFGSRCGRDRASAGRRRQDQIDGTTAPLHAVRWLLGGAYRPADGDDAAPAGYLHLGLFKAITSPISAIGIAGEGYVGARGSSADGGVRALGVLRPFGLGVGFDYGIARNEPDPILSFMRSFKRGGLFGLGGMFRLNYLPTRGHTFSIGYQIPFGDGWMGRTRPKTDHVKLPEPATPRSPTQVAAVDPALSDALARVRHAAEWQARCVTPFFDQKGDTREEVIDHLRERIRFFQRHVAMTDAIYPSGHTCPEEIRVYHEELDRAFSLAASGGTAGRTPGESSEAGRRISLQAREILLDEVLLPYNRELGRIKKPDTTRGFATQAREAFLLWLNQSSAAAPATHAGVAWVYQQLLDQVEDIRRVPDRGLGDLAARLAPDPARPTSGPARDPGPARRAHRARRRSRSSPEATSITTSSTRSFSGSSCATSLRPRTTTCCGSTTTAAPTAPANPIGWASTRSTTAT